MRNNITECERYTSWHDLRAGNEQNQMNSICVTGASCNYQKYRYIHSWTTSIKVRYVCEKKKIGQRTVNHFYTITYMLFTLTKHTITLSKSNRREERITISYAKLHATTLQLYDNTKYVFVNVCVTHTTRQTSTYCFLLCNEVIIFSYIIFPLPPKTMFAGEV